MFGEGVSSYTNIGLGGSKGMVWEGRGYRGGGEEEEGAQPVWVEPLQDKIGVIL